HPRVTNSSQPQPPMYRLGLPCGKWFLKIKNPSYRAAFFHILYFLILVLDRYTHIKHVVGGQHSDRPTTLLPTASLCPVWAAALRHGHPESIDQREFQTLSS